MKIQVTIVDDHPMVINGLQKMLSDNSEITIIDTYTASDALLEGLNQHVPDVLLLDIQLPGKTGDKLTPIILKKYPEIRILALTNFDSVFYVKNMLSHGALGYLLKSTDQHTLIDAIKTVYTYNEFIEPSLKQQIDENRLAGNRSNVQQPLLTPRESEVIQLIADGLTTQEISEKLFLSFTTVENYRFNLLSKFGVKNTAMLIKKAVQLGLVQ
jgi:DNA-binding NarL/FixJ family response regulator